MRQDRTPAARRWNLLSDPTVEQDFPELWRSFLTDIDEAAREKLRLACMGGSGVTQLYGSCEM
jgi:hypothetical protein